MSTDPSDLEQITHYLKRLSAGDSTAESPLADAVYSQMQRIARSVLQRESRGCSLQATALTNEVLLELIRVRSVEWQDRSHFFRVAARMLRRRFIDYIRAQRAAKRPQKSERVDCEQLLLPTEDRFEEIIVVNEGLDQLADFDPPLAELVEMVYFGGIPICTIAEIRGVSEKTIDRHLDLHGAGWKAVSELHVPVFRPSPLLRIGYESGALEYGKVAVSGSVRFTA